MFLQIDPATAPKVREAFQRYAAGATLEALARFLHRTPTSIKRFVLQNPVYIGSSSWGRRGKSERSGGKAGAHPTLITPDLWTAVQERLKQARLLHPVRVSIANAHPYALSGLLRCACQHYQYDENGVPLDLVDGTDNQGGRMVGHACAPAKAPEAKRANWRSYACKKCGTRVRQRLIESAVHGVVVRYFKEEDESGRLSKRLDEWIKTKLGETGTDTVARQRRDLEQRKANLLRNQAAAWLSSIRETFKSGRSAADINADLLRLRSLFRSIRWDKVTRKITVGLWREPYRLREAAVPVREVQEGSPNQSSLSCRRAR